MPYSHSTGVINYNLGNVATPTGMVATGTINYNLGTVAKPKAMGTMTSITHISGTLGTRAYAQGSLSDFFFSPAHASGDVALEQNETALVNEVGIYDTYTSQYKELTKHIKSGNSLDYQNYLVDMEVANARSEDEANQKAYKQAVQNRLNIQKQADAVSPTKIRENAKTKAKKTGSSILKKYSKKLTKSQRNSLKNGTKVNTKGIKDKKLLKQLNAYNKALDNASKKAKNSQEKYNQLSQQLTIAKNKEMEIAATAAESQAEYAQKAIEAEQTKFDNVSQYYNTKIDYEKSLADKSEKVRELDSAKGNYTNSSDYNAQISDMQKQQQLQSELAKKLQTQLDKSVKSGKIKKGSDEWLKMRTEIVEAESAVADYNTQIENLKQQQLTTKYEEMFDRAIDKADKFISKLNSIDDLISDDMKYDYETGELTEFGALSIALNAKELDSQIANIKQYAQKRKQIKDDFANGKYGEQKYDELMLYPMVILMRLKRHG